MLLFIPVLPSGRFPFPAEPVVPVKIFRGEERLPAFRAILAVRPPGAACARVISLAGHFNTS